MQTKWIWGNIVLSIFMFCTIFYLNVGVSGGDMAIVIFAFIVAILQLIVNVILLYKKQTVSTVKIVSAIILTNVFLITLFSEYGHSVNSWIKMNYH
jgi:hypothetical protein